MRIVHVQNVSKSYGKVKALREVSFEVEEGELFGLIGPDGAGKTSLFHILTTLRKPDKGEAQILGLDVVEDYKTIRPLLGYMPGRFSLYQDLTVQENLEFFASVFGTTVEENYDLIRPIFSQLEPFIERRAGALSGGMKQKLALSCALIHKPKVLLLDEPTTGVDAVSRKEFWEMLHGLRAENITIIVSTPYMDETRQCDRIALIQDGKILSIDTPAATVAAFDRPLVAVKSDNTYTLIQTLKAYEFAASVHPFGEYIHYTDSRGHIEKQALKTYLENRGCANVVVKDINPDIEDTFMYLMEREANYG